MSLIEKVAGRLGAESKAQDRASEEAPEQVADDAPVIAAPMAAAAEEPASPSPRSADAGAPIDLERLRDLGYLTPGNHMGPLAEEFRRIKRPLLVGIASAIDDGGGAPGGSNLLLVTSALPGEGKTFVSINLAISMCSEIETTVLLVDCDARRGSMAERLGVPDGPGLLDVLENRARLEDVIVGTSSPKLSVLPAGRAERIDELFASAEMRDLLSEISARYNDRVIVLDSAPLMVASESLVLAHLVGSIVMVVSADDTSAATVQEALALLEGFDNVSLLLNKASRTLGKDASYYDYRR